jgi:hypothetical protein
LAPAGPRGATVGNPAMPPGFRLVSKSIDAGDVRRLYGTFAERGSRFVSAILTVLRVRLNGKKTTFDFSATG